jgi:hypothetical protein
MPSSMHRRTNAVLDSIYSDYSDYSDHSSSSVPLTLDHKSYYSTSTLSDYENKPLPPPPKVHDPDSIPRTVPGRRGFGIDRERSTSPLRTKGLSRRPALRQSSRSPDDDTSSSPGSGGWRTPSINSVESIWFSSPSAGNIPRTIPRITTTDYDSDTSHTTSLGYDSPIDSLETDFSTFGSTDSFLCSRNRLRLYQYPSDSTGDIEELFVGPIYEVVNYIWDTICHEKNINTMIDTFSSFAIPKEQVIDLVAANAIPLHQFLKTTNLAIHINSPSKPRYTTLSTLEIQLSPNLISPLLNPANESQLTTLKALVRIAMLYQIGEYIHNHVLLSKQSGDGGREILISSSIDVRRSKEMRGGNVAVVGFLGGNVSFRWKGGRCEVLLRRDGEVRRVPRGAVEEMWRNVRMSRFLVEEMDL